MWLVRLRCYEVSVYFYLSEVFLSLQQLLLSGCGIGQQLVPAFHQRSVTSLDGFGLNVLGCEELILQRSDVGDTLLLERLKSGIECFLQ